MLKYLFVFYVILFVVVKAQGDNMLGNGLWNLVNIATCNDELNTVILETSIKRHKLNRTTDGITATLTTEKTIDESYTAYIEICKFVDGGCKQYQIISDDLIGMVKKYAENNVRRAFELASIDPPEFPLLDGEYNIEDFVMDYCELPTTAVYGRFQATAYLIKDEVHVACIRIIVEFEKPDDDEELC